MKPRIVLSVALLGVSLGHAADITAFSATADQSTPFSNLTINTTFTSTLARITNSSVSCGSEAACSGEVGTYSLTLMNLTDATPAMGTLDGMLTGTGTATGTVTVLLDGIPFKSVDFSVDAGPFSKELFSTQLPALLGPTLTISGALDLTLPAGDSIVLPNSLDFSFGAATTTVPEPVSFALIGFGLLGLAVLARRRNRT